MKVTFIGCRDGMPEKDLYKLEEAITRTILRGYKDFYCGTYGEFDFQVIRILKKVKKEYPETRIIKVKPYYQNNIYNKTKTLNGFLKIKKQLQNDFINDYEAYKSQLNKYERSYCVMSSWYELEQNLFDETFVCELNNIPPKFRIIACNKWKVKECEIIIAYTPHQNSNSWKIKEYAKRLKKIVINI